MCNLPKNNLHIKRVKEVIRKSLRWQRSRKILFVFKFIHGSPRFFLKLISHPVSLNRLKLSEYVDTTGEGTVKLRVLHHSIRGKPLPSKNKNYITLPSSNFKCLGHSSLYQLNCFFMMKTGYRLTRPHRARSFGSY